MYLVKYNSQGNPTKYSRVYTQNVRWLYKFNPPKKYHDFFFTYNSFEKLIKINNYVKSDKHSHDENEVCFFYDSLDRVSKIYVTEQYIYKAGFKFRGVKYANFSSIMETQLIYNESARVKNLFGIQFIKTDTIIYRDTALLNCTFDSLFVPPIKPKGNIYDSLGNIIEFVTYYSSHTIGGDTTYTNSKPRFIHRWTYNRYGKPEIFNTYTGDNKLIRSEKYFYNNAGLLFARQVDNSTSIICYIFNSE